MAGSDGERSFSTILRENKEEQYYHRLQRHFTKLQLRRQRVRQKRIGLVSETTTFYVYQVAKSLWPQNNSDVKWPILKFSRGRERQDA